jgi:membrane-associated protease RseP (regulator of RpoE activity)
MKNKSFKLIIAGLAIGCIPPVFALESPPDDAPPPPAVDQPEADAPPLRPLRFRALEPQPAPEVPAVAEATAYLGVVSSEIPQMLGEHLGLKPDECILVRSLMPDGPAAKAGIAINDVITRVGDHAITSPAELSKCIAGKNPGETITVELIHKGKPAKVEVTLGNRPANIVAAEPGALLNFNLEGLPEELAERIRGAIEGNLGGLDLQLGDDAAQFQPQMENAMRELKKRMAGGFMLPEAPVERGIQLNSGATFRMKDPEGSIEVKSNEGGKEVTIRDNADKIVWNGPWDTAQDKAAAPDDVRKRVASLNLDTDFKGNGLRFQMRPQPAPPDND